MSKRGTSNKIRFGTVTNKQAHFTKGRSSRNTPWNGRNMSGGRWQGHTSNIDDTPTSGQSSMFDIQSRGFEELVAFLESAGDNLTLAAQDAIAKGAVEGRKKATHIEEGYFNLGKVWTHATSRNATAPGNRWQSASRFDPGLGGYRGVGSSGNALRLINFHFVQGHTYRTLGAMPGTVEAKATSQMLSLFENTAHWRKSSPVWQSSSGGPWYGYRAGSERQGKHYFNAFYNAFGEGLLVGVEAAKKSYERRMNGTYGR